MAHACFPNVSCFPHRKHCFQGQLLFSGCKLRLRYTAGDLKKIRACEHYFATTRKRALIQLLRAIQAKAKFCEQLQIGWDHSIPLAEVERTLQGNDEQT